MGMIRGYISTKETIMRISELLQKLEEFKNTHGDLFVVVQYRDDEGEYNGHDGYLELKTEAEGLPDWQAMQEDFKDLKNDEEVLVL